MPFEPLGRPRRGLQGRSGPVTPIVSTRTSSPDEIFSKAAVPYAVDVESVSAQAATLVPFSDTQLVMLNGTALETHEALSSIGKITYTVPNEYIRYYNAVTTAFPRRRYAPGTVGAYYMSCLDAMTPDEVCAVPCIAGLPRPGAPTCGFTVFWATRSANGLEYQRLYKPETRDVVEPRALLYVPRDVSFRGIPEHIVKPMKEVMKVELVRVLRYNPTTNEALPEEKPESIGRAVEGFVPIDSLIAKAEPQTSPPKPQKTDWAKNLKVRARSVSQGSWSWFEIFIVVVLIALFIALILAVIYRKK